MATWRGVPRPQETPLLPPSTHHVPRQRQSREGNGNYSWTVKLALTVSPGLAFGWFLIAWLSGQSFDRAAKQAGFVLGVSFILLISLLPLSGLAIHYILEFKYAQPVRTTPRPRPKEVPYPVPTNGRGKRESPRSHGEKMAEAMAKGPLPRVGQAMRRAGERLASAPPPERLQGKYAQDVSPVQAWVEDPAVSQMEKLYHITRYFYGKKVVRDDFKVFGEGWQALYAEYKMWVSDTGFDWVDLDGQRTIVGWRIPEHECYASDRMLKRIAIQNGFQFPEEEVKQ